MEGDNAQRTEVDAQPSGADGRWQTWSEELDRGVVERYRRAGIVRLFVVCALIPLNFWQASRASLAADREFMIAHNVAMSPLLVVVGIAGLWMWKSRSVVRLRSLTTASMVFEIVLILSFVWGQGETIPAYQFTLAAVIVMLYRAIYDLRLGAGMLVGVLVGGWALYAGIALGWVPISPLSYARPLSAPIGLTLSAGMTFAIAHWIVSRLTSKDTAIALLRQALVPSAGLHGRLLGARYRVGPLLGAGAMADVYRGEDTRSGTTVALKVLRPTMVGDEALVRRFIREADIVRQLGSPHIVSMGEYTQDGHYRFMVMEFLEGEDLQRRIARLGRLQLPAVLDIVDDVASGLDVAHRGGVIHRDLKPANTFLVHTDEGDVAKILDFGVSKLHGAATALTQETALLGTPAYMAPEQIQGSPDQVTEAADVFSLASMVYTMLTGTPAFLGDNVPAILYAVCHVDPAPLHEQLPGVPSAVDAVLQDALTKDPDDRIASAVTFAGRLRAAAGDAGQRGRRAPSIDALGDTLVDMPEDDVA